MLNSNKKTIFDPWFFDLRSGAGAAFAEINIFHR